MKLDLQKAPINQTKSMINEINNVFHQQKMDNNLEKFVQLKLKHMGKGKYVLIANRYDSCDFVVRDSKNLFHGNRHEMLEFVFSKFYKLAD